MRGGDEEPDTNGPASASSPDRHVFRTLCCTRGASPDCLSISDPSLDRLYRSGGSPGVPATRPAIRRTSL